MSISLRTQNNSVRYKMPQYQTNPSLKNKPYKSNNNVSFSGVIEGTLVTIGLAVLANAAVKVIKKASQSDIIRDTVNPDRLKQAVDVLKDEIRQPKKIVNESYERIKHYPELISHADEIKTLNARRLEKRDKKLFDLDYYKDIFRLNTTIVAEKLRVVREATDPKLRAIFDSDRNMFWIHDGIMIHGSDRPEKKELLNYFIEEARKHDFDIVHIPVGDTDGVQFEQNVARLFPEAKQKFLNERKQTMFVIENVDEMLQKADDTHIGGPGRRQWNVHTHQCGGQGVTTLTTAKDISTLDDSSIRGGRITEKINIDKAVELSKDSADKM